MNPFYPTWKPSRIVVGVDERGLSDHAVAQAGRLSERFGVPVDLVHGIDLGVLARGTGSMDRYARYAAKLEAAARQAIEAHLNVSIEAPLLAERPLSDILSVRPGKPADVIVAHAREHGADLILLGSHQERAVFDFGGTARGVLANSPCMVWMQPEPPKAMHRILVPIESDPASVEVLETAASMARGFEAELTVLHCLEPPEFAYQAPGPTYVVDELRDSERRRFEALLDGVEALQDVRVTRHFDDGQPAQRILEVLDDYDLCVMGTHGRRGIARALLGSQAYRVLKHAKRPVVTVPLAHYEEREALTSPSMAL